MEKFIPPLCPPKRKKFGQAVQKLWPFKVLAFKKKCHFWDFCSKIFLKWNFKFSLPGTAHPNILVGIPELSRLPINNNLPKNSQKPPKMRLKTTPKLAVSTRFDL